MPIDLTKANSNKESILSTLTSKGPSLPVHLAQAAQISPLFASAFLSELYAEGKVKISNMKVGSSPLYYLAGQEHMLENFVDYLNVREKEALLLLKKEKILDDEIQSPVIRVAIRAIKDFAIPLKVRIDGKDKLIWKYFLITDKEFREIFEKPSKKEEKQIQLPKHEHKSEKDDKIKEKVEEAQDKVDKPVKQESETITPESQIRRSKRKGKAVESKFLNSLKEYIAARDIEILEVIEEKKKEFHAKIRIDTLFGKQEFYLIAKEKKKISETDLVFVMQKAQNERMSAIIMASGDLDKKANDYIKGWKNIIKFEKIKI